MDAELAAWVHGTDELPLQPLLAQAGVRLADQSPATWRPNSGCASAKGALSGIQVKTVHRGSAAERAGVRPATNCWPSTAGACAGWTMRAAGSRPARPSS